MRASGWNLITPPAREPLGETEIKAHLRIDSDDEDGLIMDYVSAARQQCEEITSRAFLTQTWEAVFYCWPGQEGFVLPRPPLFSVESIKYTNTAGVVQTVGSSNYMAITVLEPGRVVLTRNGVWPADYIGLGYPITVRYVAGTEAAPFWAVQSVRWLVGHMYENRESVIMGTNLPQKVPFSVQWLLGPHKSWY